MPLTLMIVLLASAGFGAGHAASSYDGWDRVLHDCDDDWGDHGEDDEEDSQDRSGHDLVALDVHEGTAPDDTRAVGLRLTMDLGFADDETGWLNDTVTFTVNRSSGDDFTVTTTVVTTDNETFTVASGEDQNQTLTPLERTDTDDGRFHVDLWYGYDQLGVDDGDNLTGFHVQGQFDDSDRDHMAGGYTPAEGVAFNLCPPGTDDTRQDSTPYQISQAPGLPPQPGFDVSPSDPVTGQQITVNDTSTDPDGEIIAWSWDLGDGTTADTPNLTHAYDAPGDYTVSLTVTDDRDNEVTTDQDITVADAAPEAGFTWSPNEPEAGQTVTFTDTSTDPEPGALAHEWTFGDGGSATSANPDHVYETPGTYVVTLNVTDSGGQTDTVTHEITVVEATPDDEATDDEADDQSDETDDQADDGNQDPVAEFAFSPDAPIEGQTITFRDASTDPDGEIVSYSWTFGDTVSDEERVVNHTYNEEGEYTVTLTVTDDQGATNTTSLTIDVLPASAVGGNDETLDQTAADQAGNQTNGTGNETADGVPAVPLVAVLSVLAVAAAIGRR